MINTKVTIAGVELKNPVMTASGTFGSGEEYSEFVDLNKLGAVVTNCLLYTSDARAALNAVELGVLTTQPGGDGKIRMTLEVASECIQKRVVRYDKTGDNHYDTISAFIKSMRGSDPDAAVYYLARMPVSYTHLEADWWMPWLLGATTEV